MSIAQSGILSCITFTSFTSNLCAIGSFNKTIALVDPICNSVTNVLQGQSGGVTHLRFSTDGNVLYSGGRKDCEILAWDLRNLGCVLASYKRICDTNQRIYFGEHSIFQYSANKFKVLFFYVCSHAIVFFLLYVVQFDLNFLDDMLFVFSSNRVTSS